MLTHYETILREVCKNPTKRISEIPMISSEEEKTLTTTFSQSKLTYPKTQTLVDLFETQAKGHPQQTALVFEEKTLSYEELDKRSNQVANYLISQGVSSNSLVPLYMQRGADMIIALLGILKSGGAYVSVDSDFPLSRVEYILKDTQAKWILTDSTRLKTDAEQIQIDALNQESTKRPKHKIKG